MNSLNTQDYLVKIIERLKQNGFNIQNNIKYKNQLFECVARRTKFETERFGLFSTFLLFSRIVHPDIGSLEKFSSQSFSCARKKSIVFLPRGFGYSFLCIPVAVVDSISPETAESIQKREPPKHFAAFEKLVIFSLETNKLYYCEITPMWGSLYFDRDRQTINEMLSP
jgi:hypothetical protein